MAFQNPSQNYTEHRLTLGDLTCLSAHLTYLVQSVSGYLGIGMLEGALQVSIAA